MTLRAQFSLNFFDSDRYLDAFSKETINHQPAVNINETEKELVIELVAPGLKKEDFKIFVENGIITISVEKEEDKMEHFIKHEFNYCSFSRSFTLPEKVIIEGIKAKYENGILQIHLAKRGENPSKPKLEIKVT
ncbi:Hsp20/alpha crystallin family protein [Pedobacter cryophilus]|uniref:Hsp20/alpha crystallin family protein n=1 Tax=Pedobacter cryophilus TaxID=2571271 RepID=A0A4V5NWT3_9SPHI|nr:Hsp20/alpha crystallin family protein [Pedobacter cryophilus]TKB96223.1 Hsp20/alpha crystallin family protein [Pedobacter cryophilus]